MTARVNWHEDVACRDADPDLFFPIGTTGAALRQMEEAKRICRDCPVQSTAWPGRWRTGLTDGVWGGTTPDERRVIRSLSRKTTTTRADDDDTSYHSAEPREHGIGAWAAPRKQPGFSAALELALTLADLKLTSPGMPGQVSTSEGS
jgi:WhiB family transcriptional regulator, redox-sensing transcriptional regulator